MSIDRSSIYDFNYIRQRVEELQKEKVTNPGGPNNEGTVGVDIRPKPADPNVEPSYSYY